MAFPQFSFLRNERVFAQLFHYQKVPFTMKFRHVTHVIFDMDGLLIESESFYDTIIGSIARQFGKEFTAATKIKILGTVEQDAAKIAVRDMDLPISEEEFLGIYRALAREMEDIKLMPGARKLVRHLHKHNIPIAVATSSSEESMKHKTKNLQDVFKLFHHVTCGSDPEVIQGKPAPDIFLVSASRFPDKPHPSQCLVLEDAPNGVKGANAAGMQTVLVPPPEVTMDQRKTANLVLNSLDEFKPELFGLPAFE